MKMIPAVLGIAAGIATIGGALAVVQDYRPLFRPDLAPIEGRLVVAEQSITRLNLASAQGQLIDLLRARQEYVDKGQPVPRWIDEQILFLEGQISEWQKQLGQ